MGDREEGQRVKHGTATGYRTQGCRCDDCRAAHAAYQREWHLARSRARPVSPGPETPARTAGGGGRAVLRYIDFCLEPDRPIIVDLLDTSRAAARRVLPLMEEALRARRARVVYLQECVAAQRNFIAAFEHVQAFLEDRDV